MKPEEIFTIIKEDLGDFDEFIRYIEKFINNQISE